MSKMISSLAFLAGVAVGGGVAWYYAQEKYARIAEEEIDSVKATYHAAMGKNKATGFVDGADKAAETVNKKPDLVAYARKLQSEGYTDYASTVVGKKESESIGEAPYIITPAEFGENEDYTKVSLSYFADGVLADDNNEEVDDVEEIVGDALNHFGEHEDDAVFVRNDAKKCDYEILLDVRKYEDVLADMPPH